ncbi:MAG: hypothetical protein HZA48_05525 [Planctomycetes bacterium]|nr:hypothetical protein [Planctomycetota bacterium]
MMRIRVILIIFIVLFFLSGMTVFPVEWEVKTVINTVWGDAPPGVGFLSPMHKKLIEIRDSFPVIRDKYEFGIYGLDWLGFAFITMSILFIGVLRDPVKNKWVIQFALLCCPLSIIFAAVFAPMRGMPWQWVLIDSSFGVFGAMPLIIILRDIKKIEKA